MPFLDQLELAAVSALEPFIEFKSQETCSNGAGSQAFGSEWLARNLRDSSTSGHASPLRLRDAAGSLHGPTPGGSPFRARWCSFATAAGHAEHNSPSPARISSASPALQPLDRPLQRIDWLPLPRLEGSVTGQLQLLERIAHVGG